jgi:hypothetical protein
LWEAREGRQRERERESVKESGRGYHHFEDGPPSASRGGGDGDAALSSAGDAPRWFCLWGRTDTVFEQQT